MRTGRHPAQDNPLYHFVAYGLQNPVVQWMVGRGGYDELPAVPSCPATSTGRHRFDGTRCQLCGRHRERPVCAQDFGDATSLAIAESMGVQVDWRRQLR